MQLESPSRRRHNLTLNYHLKQAQRYDQLAKKTTGDIQKRAIESAAAQRKSYNDKKTFFDKERHILGTPWLCSGLCSRTKKNGRLDWALIEVSPNRLGDNTIPSPSAWTPPYTPPLPIICNRPIQGIAASCETTTEAYKVGASTGATSGRFSHIKSDVRMLWDKELNLKVSTEYVFLGDTQQLFGQSNLLFFLRGNSGSLVFDDLGAWAGLVHGGNEKKQVSTANPVYVTDAQSLLDHMSELTD